MLLTLEGKGYTEVCLLKNAVYLANLESELKKKESQGYSVFSLQNMFNITPCIMDI